VSDSLNVTIVDSDAPYPMTSGKRLRSLNLVLPLAGRHRITYLFRATPGHPDREASVTFLRDHGIEPLPVDQPLPRKQGPLFGLRLARNLFSSWPYSVTSHLGPALRKAVHTHASTRKVDLWQLEWSGLFPLLPTGVRSLLNSQNIDTLIWKRYHETVSNPLKRWYIHGQWRRFERFEKSVFQAVSRLVMVSEPDAVLARSMAGLERVDVVDNGIDRSFFEGVEGSRDGRRILFLGSLDWRPNLDGLRLLLDEVFPKVRQAEPQATLAVVGRSPPAWLIEHIRTCPGVELHADVPDVRPYLASSGVLAVPLRVGGGSRLKILEALATGLPVISTPVGAEGLELVAGRDYVAAELSEMAAALIAAIRDPRRQQQLAASGQQVVLARYDWRGLAEKLERVWYGCLESKRDRGSDARDGLPVRALSG
jgi:polysaccharide biosynthesis protein PslH